MFHENFRASLKNRNLKVLWCKRLFFYLLLIYFRIQSKPHLFFKFCDHDYFPEQISSDCAVKFDKIFQWKKSLNWQNKKFRYFLHIRNVNFFRVSSSFSFPKTLTNPPLTNPPRIELLLRAPSGQLARHGEIIWVLLRIGPP